MGLPVENAKSISAISKPFKLVTRTVKTERVLSVTYSEDLRDKFTATSL